MKKLTLLLSGIFFCFFSFAQSPQLVPGNYQMQVQGFQNYLGGLSECIGLDGRLIFVAQNHLWRTDGTLSGTELLKGFATNDDMIRPTGLTEMSGKVYFFADDSVHGNELWVTDGTIAGTLLVKDINSGPEPSINGYSPANNHKKYNLQVFNNKLYFLANDHIHGGELWSSDGTTAGTELFYDFYPGPDGNGTFPQENITAVGDKLFFTALRTYPDTSGCLYFTLGSPNNTFIVMDSLYPEDMHIIPYGNRVLFSPDITSPGGGIYITNGTPQGTLLLSPDSISSNDIAVMNNKAYFFKSPHSNAPGILTETDGTLAGTHEIRSGFAGQSQNFTNNKNKTFALMTDSQHLYFSASSNTPDSTYWEPWISDGTTAGTKVLKDIMPQDPTQPSIRKSSAPFGFTTFNGQVYFRATDSSRTSLWRTDGTLNGTQRIEIPGANSHEQFGTFSSPRYFLYPMVSTGNALYFYATYDSTIGPRIYKLNLFPVSIGKEPEVSSIDIYPNPSQGIITIDAENAKSISIHSINGSLVYKKENINDTKHTVDTHNFATGTYTITTPLSDGTKRYGKFVKQ